jgi:hypothetical protein
VSILDGEEDTNVEAFSDCEKKWASAAHRRHTIAQQKKMFCSKCN